MPDNLPTTTFADRVASYSLSFKGMNNEARFRDSVECVRSIYALGQYRACVEEGVASLADPITVLRDLRGLLSIAAYEELTAYALSGSVGNVARPKLEDAIKRTIVADSLSTANLDTQHFADYPQYDQAVILMKASALPQGRLDALSLTSNELSTMPNLRRDVYNFDMKSMATTAGISAFITLLYNDGAFSNNRPKTLFIPDRAFSTIIYNLGINVTESVFL